MKIEQLFDADRTCDQDKVKTALMHLERKALEWHLHFMKNRALGEESWTSYLQEICKRFGSNEYTDPMLELVGLKQTQTVGEYYDEFESLLNL